MSKKIDPSTAIGVQIHLDSASLERLNKLVNVYSALRDFENGAPTISKAEYEARYLKWLNDYRNHPSEYHEKAQRIGLSWGHGAVSEYYKKLFAELHPDLKTHQKRGRPLGTLMPGRRMSVLRGEVLAMLMEKGYESLMASFSSNTKKKVA